MPERVGHDGEGPGLQRLDLVEGQAGCLSNHFIGNAKAFEVLCCLFYAFFSSFCHAFLSALVMGIVDGILVIPFLFHGEGVLPALFFGHVGKFGFFHKFFEIRVIPKQLGLLDEGRKILHHIQEPVLAQGEAVDELVWVGHAWVKVTEVEVEQAELLAVADVDVDDVEAEDGAA